MCDSHGKRVCIVVIISDWSEQVQSLYFDINKIFFLDPKLLSPNRTSVLLGPDTGSETIFLKFYEEKVIIIFHKALGF